MLAIFDELKELHQRKGEDYGTGQDPLANVRASQEFGIPPWLGAVLRANDKMSRLKTFALTGKLNNEGVEDNLKDIAVYMVIALHLFREAEQGDESDSAFEESVPPSLSSKRLNELVNRGTPVTERRPMTFEQYLEKHGVPSAKALKLIQQFPNCVRVL